MVECTVHLVSLSPGATQGQVVPQLKEAGQNILITGIPHGWIHKPHANDVDQLVGSEWHLFVLTAKSDDRLRLDQSVKAHITIAVAIPGEQHRQLLQSISNRLSTHNTPQLPAEWVDKSTGHLHIPSERICGQTEANPPAGTLQLNKPMANFLSTALPNSVNQKPVSLFNLFRYRDGDSTVHEQYMQDFKASFGDSAGAFVKFMGPVKSQLKTSNEGQNSPGAWQEANLTHYDSIYHYAYMLSTDVYQRLNKDKVRGLEDTCILLVSEVELSLGN